MKKILVRLPETKEKLLLSLPFLFKLEEEYMGAEINLILNEDLYQFIIFFPETVSTYPFKKGSNNIPGVHKFCMNLNVIFNIEDYYDLISDFKSGFMGLSFRAKRRIGYKNLYNEVFLNHKLLITDPRLKNSDQWSIDLLQDALEKKYDDYIFKIASSERKEGEANVAKLFEKEEVKDFLVVTFEPNKYEDFEMWENVLSKLEGQSIILWNMEEDNEFIERLEILSKEVMKTNDVYIMRKGSLKELYLYLMKARGILTSSAWLSLLSTLCGRSSIYLRKPQEEESYFWEHIQNKAHLVESEDAGLFRIVSDSKVTHNNTYLNLTEYIEMFFCLGDD